MQKAPDDQHCPPEFHELLIPQAASLDSSNGLWAAFCRLINWKRPNGLLFGPMDGSRQNKMRHTRHCATCSIITGLLVVAAAPARSQQPNLHSLGELSRQIKADHEKRRQKPVAVFTNDNLPSKGSTGNEDGNAKGKKNTPEGTSSQTSPASEQHGERYFRSKADEIRSQLEVHRRQLNVLQQQLGLARVQYYPDPQKTLEQESTPSFQSDIDKLRVKITATQRAIDDDHKEMENLREELRREGGDPGWIR